LSFIGENFGGSFFGAGFGTGGLSSCGYSLRFAIYSLSLRIFLVRGEGDGFCSINKGGVGSRSSITGEGSSNLGYYGEGGYCTISSSTYSGSSDSSTFSGDESSSLKKSDCSLLLSMASD
jgi:hypothetical protein